jgi:hypothetical protein
MCIGPAKRITKVYNLVTAGGLMSITEPGDVTRLLQSCSGSENSARWRPLVFTASAAITPCSQLRRSTTRIYGRLAKRGCLVALDGGVLT